MAEAEQGPWAPARVVNSLSDCYFYQTTNLPGVGLQTGEWDLRGGVDTYLGGVSLAGKRVLELGTANGFLCFEMEARGADVIAYDLGEGDDWDLVPFGGGITAEQQAERHELARKLNNAWWFAHNALKSSARVVYGNVYDVPASIESVDIATFGSILLHLRDPFLALQRTTSLVRETVVVTDMLPVFPRRSVAGVLQPLRRFSPRLADWAAPDITFIPNAATRLPVDTWWRISPRLVSRYLAVLGFTDQVITYHQQTYNLPTTRQVPMFTVVARR